MVQITGLSFDRFEFHGVNQKLQLRKVSDLDRDVPKTGPKKQDSKLSQKLSSNCFKYTEILCRAFLFCSESIARIKRNRKLTLS